MNNPLRTPEDYALFLYTLTDQFPSVRHSTVTFVRRGATLARVEGELAFDDGFRLVVRERVIFERLPVTIDWYGYEECGKAKRNCPGMIHSRTRTIQHCKVHIPTTNMCPLISSIIAFLPQK